MKYSDPLLERSRQRPDSSMLLIPTTGSPEDLTAVSPGPRLMVQPIWLQPVDRHEGRLYGEYIAKMPAYQSVYVRLSVLKKLRQASECLPPRYKLIVRAGHRPLKVQERLLAELVHEYRISNPQAAHEQALEFARTFVSDPFVRIPPHCCGAAVDVDLFDRATGKLVDFGCPMNTDDEISFLHSPKITKAQQTNRLTLLKAMLAAGFASNYYEWWHYSYGDQKWAWFYGEPYAIYNLAEPRL